MSNDLNYTVHVLKDTSDNMFYSPAGWKNGIKGASKYATIKTPQEVLKYFGTQGHEWYPQRADDAVAKGNIERADSLRETAAYYVQLFNNCRVETYNIDPSCVSSFGMKATSQTSEVVNWTYEESD